MAEIVISSVDHGSTVELRLGDTLVVRLPESPGTGFRWALGSDSPSVLEPNGDSYVPGSGGGIGGGGNRQFSFRAVGAGTRELNLVKWREWEGESSIKDRFSVVAAVR